MTPSIESRVPDSVVYAVASELCASVAVIGEDALTLPEAPRAVVIARYTIVQCEGDAARAASILAEMARQEGDGYEERDDTNLDNDRLPDPWAKRGHLSGRLKGRGK